MNKKIIHNLLFAGLLFIFIMSGQSATASSDMARAQKGKILLQVEANGEAWYVNPSDERRYYMGRPHDAFTLMRQLGVGITTANLKKIKIAAQNMAGADTDGDGLSDMFEDAIGTDKTKKDTDGDGFSDYDEFIGGYNPLGAGKLTGYDTKFTDLHKGKIFIQVEQNGEAWYINPADGLRYFMGRPADAFGLMRGLGLGITNANLAKIQEKAGYGLGSGQAAAPAAPAHEADDPALDPALSAIIEAHQEKIKEFIPVYDLYEKSKYEKLAVELFVSSSQSTAKKLTDEFFIEFVDYTLKRLNKISLNDEYVFAAGDEEIMPPYEKTDDATIIIGLGVDFVMPYELKNEGGNWKINLSLAQAYYDETARIEAKEEAAEASEVEVYLMDKVKSALQSYKSSYGKYPKYLYGAVGKYSALKDYADDFYYAVPGDNPQKCHLGIEVMDDESKLKSDADFDSLAAGYPDGFDGDDPVYDIVLE